MENIKVPAYEGWETVGLANLDGAVWFRTTFDVPENWLGKDLVLDLNRIRDQDFTYINGNWLAIQITQSQENILFLQN